jgi:acetyl esterase/lipase
MFDKLIKGTVPMKVLSTAIVFLLGVSTAMVSGYEPQKEIILWPKGMPEPKVQTEMPEASIKGKDGISRRSNVSNPRLIVFKPETGSKASKAAIIVVPGGGFGILADEHEGSDACKWLAKNGITALQLVHRTPTNKHTEPHAGPVQDLQKAIIEVRNNAADLNIDTDKIGVLGFSAGGQVTPVSYTHLTLPTID